MRNERLARFLLVTLLTLAGVAVGASWYGQNQVMTVRARMPEAGGWMPGEIHAVAGEPLRLRLTSEDVTHSFAVGKLDLAPIDIHPGEVAEISLTFDEPGTYTYYCTRWCGANHWRMRGTIEVTGDPSQAVKIEEQDPPLYVELGIDIDAPHPAQATPPEEPVTTARAGLLNQVPESYRDPAYYRTHSPAEAWEALRSDPFTRELNDQAVWSLIAAIWQANTTPEQLAQSKDLYAQNCAACHGENGAGDGVFANQPVDDMSMTDIIMTEMNGGDHGLKVPADFTDAENMLGASPALLHGKILRGGMGTGMPYWGPILTNEQIWAMVAYLWTFQFEYNLEVDR